MPPESLIKCIKQLEDLVYGTNNSMESPDETSMLRELDCILEDWSRVMGLNTRKVFKSGAFIEQAARIMAEDKIFRSQKGTIIRPTTFKNIKVMAIEAILMAWKGGAVWKGGPQCPEDNTSVVLEHYRGNYLSSEKVTAQTHFENWKVEQETLFWCGPLHDHFGHQVGEFGGRVLLSSLDQRKGTLLFLHSDERASWHNLLPWQKEWIAYLNPTKKPVRISSGKFVANKMIAHPQYQRLNATPTIALLAALHWRSNIFAGPSISQPVIVSRALYSPGTSAETIKGCVAGEKFFDAFMAKKHFKILYPETLSLQEQLQIYYRAEILIFSEGSAMHALELLGPHPSKKIIIIARRPFWEGMDKSLIARFPKLIWIDAVDEIYYRKNTNPRVKGLAIINWKEVLDRLQKEIDISFTDEEINSLIWASKVQLNEILINHPDVCRLDLGADQQIYKSSNGGFW